MSAIFSKALASIADSKIHIDEISKYITSTTLCPELIQ